VFLRASHRAPDLGLTDEDRQQLTQEIRDGIITELTNYPGPIALNEDVDARYTNPLSLLAAGKVTERGAEAYFEELFPDSDLAALDATCMADPSANPVHEHCCDHTSHARRAAVATVDIRPALGQPGRVRLEPRQRVCRRGRCTDRAFACA